MATPPADRPKVLIVTNWDWTIYNFRLPLAKMLRDEGCEVVFVCPFGRYVDRIQEQGFRCRDWKVSRHGVNPVNELKALLSITQIYREEQPDLISHFTLKPNLYGGLATALPGLQSVPVVNTFEGLGKLFASDSNSRLLRALLTPFLRFVSSRSSVTTVFLNREDQKTFIDLGLARPEKTEFIPGIGVNVDRFSPGPCTLIDTDAPTVVMACRLLKEKGVEEFAEAGRLLSQRGTDVELILAGEPDAENPDSVSREHVQAWHDAGMIRWVGHIDDVPSLLRCGDVAALPTAYNEGVPRFLMEAAATELPLLASDIPGCRLIVEDGQSGRLLPPRDAESLADAIEDLVQHLERRHRWGARSRELVLERFKEEKINREWYQLFRDCGL